MKTPGARRSFYITMDRLDVCKIDEKTSYADIHARYPFVVMRDTLLFLGVEFAKAERMAGECTGTARQRFNHCTKEMREMGIYYDMGDE